MVALNKEYLLGDLNNISFSNSFFKFLKGYIALFIKAYRAKRFLTQINKNIDLYLKLNNIKTAQEIDEILMQLEDFSEMYEEIEEELKKEGILFRPLLYIFEQVERANMSLQAMLASKQAEMMAKS